MLLVSLCLVSTVRDQKKFTYTVQYCPALLLRKEVNVTTNTFNEVPSSGILVSSIRLRNKLEHA